MRLKIFYNVSDKELCKIRKTIFQEVCLPILDKHGFYHSPFVDANWGWHSCFYGYDLCRLNGTYLECISSVICKGDRWIQIRLNIFTLNQMPESLFDLNGLSGMKFKLPPNSTTNERIDIGLSEGIPLFNPRTYKNYRLKRFWTKRGLEKQTQRLCSLLQHDMENINAIVEKWHTVHKCNLTDWEGNIIEQKGGLR